MPPRIEVVDGIKRVFYVGLSLIGAARFQWDAGNKLDQHTFGGLWDAGAQSTLNGTLPGALL